MARGRPTEQITESPRKFIREFHNKNGCYTKWHYNLDKTQNGPVMVEIFCPDDAHEEKNQENLPKTKRKYLNPANGKMVAYTRAKELGII